MEEQPVAGRVLSFWPCQLGGWAVYAAANVAALLPSRHARDYVAYRSMYLTVGFVGTFIMYPLCRSLRRSRRSLLQAFVFCVAVGYLLGIPAAIAITWAEIHFGGSRTALHWETVLANAVGVTFVYVGWSAFYFGIKQYQDAELNRSRLQASESLARDAQLRALRYQMHPHFLFNTLNAISTLVLAEKPRQATQVIARLGALLRMTLDSPEVHETSLDQELAITEEYLQIEQLRFGAGLKICFAIDPEARQLLVPRFLLQPLVENAVRHGIAQRRDGGEITISAKSGNGALSIKVENEVGVEASTSSKPEHTDSVPGLGLTNTQLRLRQLYGEAATMSAGFSSSSSFCVIMSLPMVFSLDAQETGHVTA